MKGWIFIIIPLVFASAGRICAQEERTLLPDTLNVQQPSSVARPDSLGVQMTPVALPDTLNVQRVASAATVDTLVVRSDSLTLLRERLRESREGAAQSQDEATPTMTEEVGGKKHKKAKYDSRAVRIQRNDTLRAGQILLEDGTITYTDAFLDTLEVKKNKNINDYTMIGIQWGMAMNSMSWNPSMEQSSTYTPINIGFLYTRYGKIFGYMPYFGIQLGLFYTQEGYKLKEGYSVSGATQVKMNVVEAPALAHFHFDFWKMKIIANLGFYVSYRLDIERSADEELPPSLANNFLSTDHRFDYGLKGGGGFGFVFDPIEIHITAMYKYGWGSLYDADYYSQYYYRFAHVSNLIISAGVHFQLTKRTGKSNSQLKKEARQIIYERNHGKQEE